MLTTDNHMAPFDYSQLHYTKIHIISLVRNMLT